MSETAPKITGLLILIAALVLLNSRPVAAQELTGRQMLASCRSVGTGRSIDGSGFCLGTVRTIVKLELTMHYWGTCMAFGPTLGERVGVVVRWLDAHPDKRGDDFILCVIAAFEAAYPCTR